VHRQRFGAIAEHTDHKPLSGHNAVIRVFDGAGTVIETHKETRVSACRQSNRNVTLSAFKDVDGKRYGTKYRTDQALGQRMARPNSRRTQRQGRKSVLFRYLPHLSHYLRCRHFFCPHVSGRKGRFSHQECALRRFDLMNKRVLPFTPRIVPLWDQNRNRRRRHSTHEIRQKLRFASLVLHV